MLQKKSPITAVEDKGGWTIETLRAYLLALMISNDVKYSERFEAQQTAMHTALTAQQTAMEAALKSAERAVLKAELASDKRFESVNEFRATLADLQKTYMSRLEAMAMFKSIDEKLSVIQTNYDSKLEALRSTMEKGAENLSKEIAGLRESRAEGGGKHAGANTLWGYIVGAAGLTGTLVALIMHFTGK